MTLTSLGQFLKAHREESGVTLEEIARRTRINLAYLKDLEEDRLEHLPAPIFTIGFLKQYAQCVGLDPQEVVARYRHAAEGQGQGRQQNVAGKSRWSGRRSFLVVAGLVGVLVLLWIVLRPGVPENGERIRSIRLPRSSPEEMDKEKLRKELDLHTGASPESSARTGVFGSAGSEAGPETLKGGEPLGPMPVAITVQALRKTWVQVTVDDSPPTQQNLEMGDQLSYQAERRVVLKIGNGNGVRIFYSGKVFENLGREDEVVQVFFPAPES
jgi:cytoskeletal protein RodZ